MDKSTSLDSKELKNLTHDIEHECLSLNYLNDDCSSGELTDAAQYHYVSSLMRIASKALKAIAYFNPKVVQAVKEKKVQDKL